MQLKRGKPIPFRFGKRTERASKRDSSNGESSIDSSKDSNRDISSSRGGVGDGSSSRGGAGDTDYDYYDWGGLFEGDDLKRAIPFR